MKKIVISVVALAALSTVAFAEGRGYDLGSNTTNFGKYSTRNEAPNANTFAFAVEMDGQSAIGFDRLKKLSEENDQGRH